MDHKRETRKRKKKEREKETNEEELRTWVPPMTVLNPEAVLLMLYEVTDSS